MGSRREGEGGIQGVFCKFTMTNLPVFFLTGIRGKWHAGDTLMEVPKTTDKVLYNVKHKWKKQKENQR